MKRAFWRIAAILVLSGVIASCTMFIEMIGGPNALLTGQSLSIIEANNKTVDLGSGTFRGPLRIKGNSVTVIGVGTGKTVITGGVIIDGNNNRLEDLSVEGPVRITGNNNDLRAAELRSNDAEVDGNNNRM